ncbi:hypothetical protein [Actinomycetospora termitidis]|uniref:Uncharacterized protein n=1 Tax=Actinomycetospora termitidis TaxID=3053470 RepID=A0ABT7MHN2_9PSEU|nr:hypothetical protein [Actinomycetospora sp. Odt1-22]MDL5159392.1 hypothetical protein [Actinomycetospora sp. Odt1-22]
MTPPMAGLVVLVLRALAWVHPTRPVTTLLCLAWTVAVALLMLRAVAG